MNNEKRQEEAIEMLLEVYNGIEEHNPYVMDDCTLIKGIKPDNLKFVIKEAILAIAYS